jgi:hypothetical protein
MSRVVHDTNQDYDDDEDDDLPENPMAKGKTGGAMKSGGDATLGLDDSDDDSE